MWPRLLGPILIYDLVATTRRGHHVLFRVLYVAVVAAILLVMYYDGIGRRRPDMKIEAQTLSAMRIQLIQLNEDFFQRFMFVEFLAIVLLTPSVTAGAIAEDKERRTLEFLLATNLNNYEIVVGKLVSRLAYMGLLMLAGLPVLALLQFLGGVEPALILAGFAAAGSMLFSLASLSILNSVIADKPRTAIFLTYFEVTLYFLASIYLPHLWKAGTLPQPVEWFCAGNIYTALMRLKTTVAATGTLLSGLPQILGQFATFHVSVALATLFFSIVGLRVWTRRQASGAVRHTRQLRVRSLPQVGNLPVLWKELYAEPLYRLQHGGSIVLTTLSAGLIVCGGMLVFALIYLELAAGKGTDKIQGIARLLTMIAASLALLATAMRACGAFAGERDRQTLDSLLTTPLKNSTIVWGKWFGSVLSVRKVWAWLFVLWLIAMALDAMGFFAVLWLLLACLIYSCFAASLGLWCSLHCRTTMRATVFTLLVLLMATWGHHLLMWCAKPLLEGVLGSPYWGYSSWVEGIKEFQTYGLTPPQTLNWLASQYTEFHEVSGPEMPYLEAHFNFLRPMEMVSAGLFLHVLATMVLVQRIHARFAAVTGRLPLDSRRRRTQAAA
jgi:ABC-type transport system involved in multi-copper enzyme maturation permease subunit